MPRGDDQSPLLGHTDAGCGTTVVFVGTDANFNEYRHGAVAADQVNFAATDAEVTLNHFQALTRQIVSRRLLASRTSGRVDRSRFAARHRMRSMNAEIIIQPLYVVATPIGNLGDITLRALDVLRSADLVACEDTRHARHLLDHHGIRTATLALHQHNENEAAAKLISALADGKRVALISDAGTPGVSDPGARAVSAVRAASYKVVPLPGANAEDRKSVV